MLDDIFDEIKVLLQKGITEKGHAFRYCTVATVDQNNIPQQRTMVFRELSETLELFVYTDQRSSKIKQLHSNKHISLLFYEPKSRIQIKINGIAEILSEKMTKKRWDMISDKGINDYCTTIAPGSTIKDPTVVSYNYEQPYFSVVKITTETIEYLRLDHPNHIRAKYILEENQWKSSFIAP